MSPIDRGCIRVKALAIVRRGDELLVSECEEPPGRGFHRPPGGTVEFGERAEDCLRRELREELGCGVVSADLIATVENLFAYDGQPGHEVVFLFETTLDDPGYYERDESFADEEGVPYRLVWRHLVATSPPLYPDDLQAILEAER
jgi:ADP-ribose pyrophosphatase YjhB (NUDIX family)